ncbi:MAG: class I SAM-dependent RNA methyltransferase [Chlamydiae bacterium]|nr:class I SAM-dependent RNA methyltransferase [Chlamydiota bacterium]MBI3277420.1 class I SAM-dependent RNA methyltransferase [Chlamydiota bacterium]
MENPSSKYCFGDLIELQLDSIAFGGEAVARLDGLVIFVEGGIDGEKVLAEVIQVKKKFLRARVKEILEPSSHRIKPSCSVFGECGGCQYQHIDYPHQLKIKENQVRDALERIGRLKDFEIEPIIGSSQAYGYRSRVDFHVVRDRDEIKIGFVNRSNESVIDVDHCPITSPQINQAYQMLRQKILKGEDHIPEWTQGIKFWETENGVEEFFLSHCGKVDLRGFEFISLKVDGKTFKVPPLSFFQVNLETIPFLIQCVRDFLELKGDEFLLDTYCGVGLFGVFLGSKVRKCVGVESDESAISFAKINAQENGLSNCKFVEKSVEKFLKQGKKDLGESPDRIILDPTRAGCTPSVLESLVTLGTPQVVYVSCNPTTLARDLSFLVKKRYHLDRIQPIDLFPQTQHCEVVVSLKIQNSKIKIQN